MGFKITMRNVATAAGLAVALAVGVLARPSLETLVNTVNPPSQTAFEQLYLVNPRDVTKVIVAPPLPKGVNYFLSTIREDAFITSNIHPKWLGSDFAKLSDDALITSPAVSRGGFSGLVERMRHPFSKREYRLFGGSIGYLCSEGIAYTPAGSVSYGCNLKGFTTLVLPYNYVDDNQKNPFPVIFSPIITLPRGVSLPEHTLTIHTGNSKFTIYVPAVSAVDRESVVIFVVAKDGSTYYSKHGLPFKLGQELSGNGGMTSFNLDPSMLARAAPNCN